MGARLLAAAAGLAIAGSTAAMAQGIEVTDAWARAMPGGAQTGAVYMTILSPTPDRLTGISTPVAQKAELHSMTMDNGVMKMREVDGVDLPAATAVTLKPGGQHIMLTGLAHPLREGDSFPLTLSFAKGGNEQITVAVKGVGAMGPPGMMAPHSNLPMTMPMPAPR
jgi:copper(I)-binding protein